MSKVYLPNSNSHRSSMAQGSTNSNSNTPRVGTRSGTPTAPVQQQVTATNVPSNNQHGHQQQQNHHPHRQYGHNPHHHHHHQQQQQHQQHPHNQQQPQQQQQQQPHIQQHQHHHQPQQHSQHHQQQPQHQQAPHQQPQQHSQHHQPPPHHQQPQTHPQPQQHPHPHPQSQQQQPPPLPQTQPQPIPQPQSLPPPPPPTQQQQMQLQQQQQQQIQLQQQHQQQHYPNGQQIQLSHIQVNQYQNHPMLLNQHQPVQQQQPLPHQPQQQFLPQPPYISQHPQMGVPHPPPLGPVVLQPQPPPTQQQQHPSIQTQPPPHFQGGGEAHMTNRLPLNPQHYMIQNPYPQGHPYLQPLYQMTNLNTYPGSHMPQPSPAMMPQPIRVSNDLGIRQQYEPQNQQTPLPVTTALSQLPVAKPPLTPATMPSQVTIASTPVTPMPVTKPIRERKALAIVDPRTKHVFTVDELKGSPTTPQNQSTTKDPGVQGISPKDASISDKELTDDTTSRSIGESISSEKPSEEHTSTQETSPKGKTVDDASAVSKPTEADKKVLENGDNNVQVDTVSELTESIEKMAVSDMSNDAGATEDKISGETEDSQDSKESENSTDSCDTREPPTKENPLPNLPYAAGQFSPLNPNGRRKYSIEFLKAVAAEMKLDLCTTSAPNHRGYDSFVPHYVNQNNIGSNFRDFTPSQTLSRRSSQQAISKPRRVITTHSLQQEVELKTAEKPWKPELENEKTKIVESGEMDTKRLLKVFRGHLNKLTPQKYDSLIEKIGALDLDGPERLNSVIDLVFDKAVDEPGFCELYARMCKVIAAKDSDFCFHLVKKCQEEFETSDLYTGLNVEERKIEIEQESDAAKRKLMSEELYEEMRLRRKKYLGTIKLIGEMYKLGLLLPKIIGLCMTHLIEEASNENIECLCSLIATVGLKMANEPEDAIKSSLKNTLNVLQDIAYSKRTNELFTLESRIKFKILDTIDLSKRSWRPRMVENNPKKIEEIHEEAKEELLRQQHHTNQSKNMSRSDDRDRSRRGGIYNSYPAKGGQANKSGW